MHPVRKNIWRVQCLRGLTGTKLGEIVDYINTVKSHLAPFLNTSHESVKGVDQELK